MAPAGNRRGFFSRWLQYACQLVRANQGGHEGHGPEDDGERFGRGFSQDNLENMRRLLESRGTLFFKNDKP